MISPKDDFELDNVKLIYLLSDKKNFKNFDDRIIKQDGYLDFNWLRSNLINYQRNYNIKSKINKIYKTHSVRTNYFTNKNVNLGFIYIVRDPRDVVISLAAHTGSNFDIAIDQLLNNFKLFTTANYANELVSTWENNIYSWLNYKDVSRLIIRYEDLLNETHKTIIEIKSFLKNISNNLLISNDVNIENVIKNSSFNNLKKLEDKNGFSESSKHTNFFREGKAGQWKYILSSNQIKKIESKLKKPMCLMNYL